MGQWFVSNKSILALVGSVEVVQLVDVQKGFLGLVEEVLWKLERVARLGSRSEDRLHLLGVKRV